MLSMYGVPKPVWMRTDVLVPPHMITHPERLEELYNIFRTEGWDTSKPVLRGYWDENGKIQLISGTHRRAAAELAGIKVPVLVWPSRDFVYQFWGTKGWDWIMGIGEYVDAKI